VDSDGLATAGSPANPEMLMLWQVNRSLKRSTTPFHTSAEEFNPGMKIIAGPCPMTVARTAEGAAKATVADTATKPALSHPI
jgi:hypothetical protein